MKIVFLNIWDCKVEGVIQNYILEQAQDTDIFCFQEAYEKTKWLLRNILKDYVLVSDYKYITDNENFPMATYYRKDLNCLESNTLLKEIPKIGLALNTKFLYKGTEVSICNVHGVSKPDDKLDNSERILQSQMLIDYYKDVKGMKIIGGDFNLNEKSKSILMFKHNGYANLIEDYKITTTRNRLVWERYPDTKMYYSDYAFVSDSKYVQSFDVPQNEISDHLPLILSLAI